MKKKRKRNLGTPSPERYDELREQHERTQRMLAERIAYHQARIAERERAEGGQTAAS